VKSNTRAGMGWRVRGFDGAGADSKIAVKGECRAALVGLGGAGRKDEVGSRRQGDAQAADRSFCCHD
jgi:hypothetical protein